MELTYTDDWVFVQTADPAHKKKLLQLDAVQSKKGYRLPKHIWSMRELVKHFPQLKDSKSFLETGEQMRKQQDEMLFVRKHFLRSGDKLRPYQAEDVGYLLELTSAGIFNEPRTGKTPTTITLLKELGLKRNLIVCPASLILNWAKEFETWWPGCRLFIAHGTKSKRQNIYRDFWADDWRFDHKSAVMISSKDTLKSDVAEYKMQADTCVVDEAHFLRNLKTAQTKAIFSIKARRRYALTGTPTVKSPADIFGILHFLEPKKFASYWQFVDRYFTMQIDWMGHREVGEPKAHRTRELQELIGFMAVQRKRQEVMPWLPSKQHTVFWCKMDGKQAKLYADMQKNFIASDGEIEIDTANVISQMMRLQQLCTDPRLLGFDVPGAKTDALLEFLENNPMPVVIMSKFTSYLKFLEPLIQKINRKVAFIHGECSADEKTAAASGFQAGAYDTLLCNVVSAGTGFTLDRAETCIFLDKPFNPSELEQAEDRICPVDESRNHKHEIISFTMKGSIEEKIDEILANKKSVTQFINEGGREAIRRLLGLL